MSTKNLIYTGLFIVGVVVVANYVWGKVKSGKVASAKGSILGTTAAASVGSENQ